LQSIERYWDRTVIIDQSADGIPTEIWDGCVAQWKGTRSFTTVQNWMQAQARWWRLPCYFFLHSDVVCQSDAIDRVLDVVADHDRPWGLGSVRKLARFCQKTR